MAHIKVSYIPVWSNKQSSVANIMSLTRLFTGRPLPLRVDVSWAFSSVCGISSSFCSVIIFSCKQSSHIALLHVINSMSFRLSVIMFVLHGALKRSQCTASCPTQCTQTSALKRSQCARLRNDLYCVGWGVKLCSTSTQPAVQHFHMLTYVSLSQFSSKDNVISWVCGEHT